MRKLYSLLFIGILLLTNLFTTIVYGLKSNDLPNNNVVNSNSTINLSTPISLSSQVNSLKPADSTLQANLETQTNVAPIDPNIRFRRVSNSQPIIKRTIVGTSNVTTDQNMQLGNMLAVNNPNGPYFQTNNGSLVTGDALFNNIDQEVDNKIISDGVGNLFNDVTDSSFKSQIGKYLTLYLKDAYKYTYTASVGGSVNYSVSGDYLYLKGLKAGNVTIYVKYNDQLKHRIYFKVLDNLSITASNVVIMKGDYGILTINSGNPPYKVSSSNTNNVRIYNYGSNYRYEGVNFGVGTLTVTDNEGFTASVSINVIPRNVKLSTYSINITQGDSGTFQIVDGNGNYSIKRSNANVTLNLISTNNYRVNGISPGQTTLEIQDSQGKKARLNVNVLPKVQTLKLDKSQIDIFIGQTIVFNILSGNGSYNISRNNSNVSYYKNGSDISYSVTGNYKGSSIITVSDKLGQTAKININIIEKDYDLVLDKTNIEVFERNSNSFKILLGNGDYIVRSNNNSIATVSGSGINWQINGKSSGNTTIMVSDKKGKTRGINVTVKSNPIVNITNIKYSNYISTDGLGGGYFEIVGTAKQVGIDYYYDNNVGTNIYDNLNSTNLGLNNYTNNLDNSLGDVTSKQQLYLNKQSKNVSNSNVYSKQLDLQQDNIYSFLLDLKCGSFNSCKFYFKPYVLDNAGNKYYGTSNWLSVSKQGNKNGIALDIGESNQIPLVEINGLFAYDAQPNINTILSNEDIAINNGFNDAFSINIYQIGENIGNFVRSNQGVYDGVVDALNDQIQDLKDALDPETYKMIVKQIKLLAVQLYDKGFEKFKSMIANISSMGEEVVDALVKGFYAVMALSVYDKQYYSSYFGTVIMIGQITSKLPIPKKIYTKLLDKIHEARSKWLKFKLLNIKKLSFAYTSSFIDFVTKVDKFGGDYIKKLDDYLLLLESKFDGTDTYDFIHKLLNNTDAAIKDALDNQQLWIIFYKLQVWKEKLTKHVFEGDISLIGTYKISGVHFKSALKEFEVGKFTHGDVVRFDGVKVGTNIYGEDFYNYGIKSFSSEKFAVEMNNPMIPWDRKGWVFKQGISTFFPDTRTVEKVKAEVELAFKNLTMCLDKNTKKVVRCGKMSDGKFVQFYHYDYDFENLSTAFPNLNLELAQ